MYIMKSFVDFNINISFFLFFNHLILYIIVTILLVSYEKSNKINIFSPLLKNFLSSYENKYYLKAFIKKFFHDFWK